MPRSPKSSDSPRWAMPSFFSSSFSNKRTASTTGPRGLSITTEQEDSLKEESPTPAQEAVTTSRKEDTGPWILFHDRNGRRILWNKITGQWTFDGIKIFAPPGTANGVAYSNYRPHQQRQQQQLQLQLQLQQQQQQLQQHEQLQQHQHLQQQQQEQQQRQRQQQQLASYAQPTAGYYPPPRPYAAVQHQLWQQPPPPMAAAVVAPPMGAAVVPRMAPAAPGVAPIFF